MSFNIVEYENQKQDNPAKITWNDFEEKLLNFRNPEESDDPVMKRLKNLNFSEDPKKPFLKLRKMRNYKEFADIWASFSQILQFRTILSMTAMRKN